MDIKIFRANHGEGKTKWLFERAVEAYDAGYELYYVGTMKSMDGVIQRWMTELQSACPIRDVFQRWLPLVHQQKYCFLTDGVFPNAGYIGDIREHLSQFDGVWYMTMDKENFVN
jgi:hypothetical protein